MRDSRVDHGDKGADVMGIGTAVAFLIGTGFRFFLGTIYTVMFR